MAVLFDFHWRRAVCGLLAAGLLGACGVTDPVQQQAGAPLPGCDAERVQHVLGESLTEEMLERLREQADAVEVRLLRPDSIITKEYKRGRLNVVADEQGRVVRVYCG